MSYKQKRKKRKSLIKAYQEAGYSFGKMLRKQVKKFGRGTTKMFENPFKKK